MPTKYDTPEFQESDGPLQHNAATAWNDGWTGSGVTIGIVDTGIDKDSPEFAGRISSKSKDIFGQRGYNASDDHGTDVAMVAAAARNNTGIVGIAWNSTILAIRADNIDSCKTDNPDSADDCAFDDLQIANSVNYAVANGAKVINLSLGGDSPTNFLKNAVTNAVNAGVVVVVAAGNDGSAEIDAFAAGLDTAGGGGVIVVGSVNKDGVISDFSDRAGSQPDHYIAARGEDVCCTYKNGQLYVDPQGYAYLFSGTSFSAPQVSGAAALLAQAFPNLTGKEIVDILLRSAFDAGDTGVDAVYGHGILDIAKAFQPIGTMSLAGGTTAIALGDTSGSTSPAMGDAVSTASLPAVVLDEYKRAFGVNLAGTLAAASPREPLYGSVGVARRSVAAGNEKVSIAFSIDASGKAGEMPKIRQLSMGREDAEAARVLAGRVALQLSPKTKVAFGFSQGTDGLVAQLQGQSRPAFMIAGDASGDSGLYKSVDSSLALRHQLGKWGLTVSADRGDAVSASTLRLQAQQRGNRYYGRVHDFGLSLDRRFGALDTALGLTWMQEDETLLGARFHEAFGLAGADTLFLDANAGWSPAQDWRIGASFRQGWTRAHVSGAVAGGSRLVSRAWSFDLTRANLLVPDDSLGLRISQPMRVESGGLNLSLPVDYSYATLSPTYGVSTLSLSPQGREIDGELAWSGPFLSGIGSASLYYRRQPGHFASLPDDKGVALSWATKF